MIPSIATIHRMINSDFAVSAIPNPEFQLLISECLALSVVRNTSDFETLHLAFEASRGNKRLHEKPQQSIFHCQPPKVI